MSTPPFDFVSTTLVDRLVMAHDASLYRLVPSAVARPRDRHDLLALLDWCRRHQQHLTFRAAGTSLSGQAVTDGVLVDLSRHWDRITISDNGDRVRVQPGVTGGRVNALLAPYGKKLGPDPASMQAAMVGGIVANNASGMCCGTALNSYHTVESMRIILVDGWSLDTSDIDADLRLQRERTELHRQISLLRDEIRADRDLVALIRRKYRIKNTIGYSLNAFLDEEQPAQILMRLMIGSEGTLGFIEDVTYRTIAEATEKHTGIFVYDTLEEACASVDAWAEAGAAAVELMDDASLRSFADLPHTPDHLRIRRDGAAALLVEFHDRAPQIGGPWTTDRAEQALLWRLRKGLMPTIGAMRPAGSTMINEDIAVPREYLAALVRDVQEAFTDHGYQDGIIFGHAKDGNIHFVVNQSFSNEQEIDRYARFMDRIADIVVGTYGGSLKAEHGTGRNMAPYVEREWGSAAFTIMKRLKDVLDPDGLLNPDVVLSSDPFIHVKHIKPVPTIDHEVDACIECGFCEHVCPTRTTSLTPRQRIVLRREIMETSSTATQRELQAAESKMSIDSCAVDSMCRVVCPVGIDTGALVKRVRSEHHGTLMHTAANVGASHWGVVDRIASLMFRPQTTNHPTTDHKPLTTNPTFVYLPSCPSRWADPQVQHLQILAARAGINLLIPEKFRQLCCGQPFASKGFPDAARQRGDATLDVLQELGAEQDAPIITDASTCAAALVEAANRRGVKVVTPGRFLSDVILPSLPITQRADHVILHPGCGSYHTSDVDRLRTICAAASHRVSIPTTAFCCGQAGDHGTRHPEVPAGALSIESEEIRTLNGDVHVSLNAMCQQALGMQTNQTWISVFELLVRASS